MMPYYIYIMASQKRGTIYVGMTNDIAARVTQHQDGSGSEFTSKYGVKRHVRVEQYGEVSDAIVREKWLKRW